VAVINRSKEAAIALLAAGANPNARTATGDTALTLAASNCTDLALHMVHTS
jgi:ankyrin repeat protein